MASSIKAGRAHWRGIPVALKVLALCMIALAALLWLLPAPPDSKPGGVTAISRHVPVLRDTVDPLAKASPSAGQVPVFEPSVSPQLPPVAPPAPQAPPLALPVRKPEVERPPEPAPAPEWSIPRIQAPSGQQQKREIARLPAESAPEAAPGRSAGLPSKSEIRGWVKSQAWEFLGGVDAQGNILYRFEVWLDAPQELIRAIKSVSYEYDAPSATPKSRESDKSKGGFRARFGALACAKEITVTVTMADGRSRRAEADGCRALN